MTLLPAKQLNGNPHHHCNQVAQISSTPNCRKPPEGQESERPMPSHSDTEFSRIIRCPVTKSSLETADSALITSLNQQILEKKLVNRIGQTVAAPLEGGYINESQTLLLPIRGGIVILIEDQAIDLTETT